LWRLRVQLDAPDNSVGRIGHVIVIGGPMLQGAFEDQHPVKRSRSTRRSRAILISISLIAAHSVFGLLPIALPATVSNSSRISGLTPEI